MTMDEDQDTMDYKRREIAEALRDHSEGLPLKVKVLGEAGSSKYLSASPAQVRAIREILGGGSLEDIATALAGDLR